ncbi:MAG: hypothetical protein CME06_17185 [Gemmatimonadetes bacterium]|nr:hypothetical protein [Gemmatimonadota bacterium]
MPDEGCHGDSRDDGFRRCRATPYGCMEAVFDPAHNLRAHSRNGDFQEPASAGWSHRSHPFGCCTSVEKQSSDSIHASPFGSARPPVLLLIDDSPGFLRSASRVLADDGMIVKVATTTRHATEILESSQVDGVLLDPVLRGSDGLAFLRKLATEYPSVTASVVTGHLSGWIISEARRYRALDVLSKPVQGSELLGVARALVGTPPRE